jgi:hypothetical protein
LGPYCQVRTLNPVSLNLFYLCLLPLGDPLPCAFPSKALHWFHNSRPTPHVSLPFPSIHSPSS